MCLWFDHFFIQNTSFSFITQTLVISIIHNLVLFYIYFPYYLAFYELLECHIKIFYAEVSSCIEIYIYIYTGIQHKRRTFNLSLNYAQYASLFLIQSYYELFFVSNSVSNVMKQRKRGKEKGNRGRESVKKLSSVWKTSLCVIQQML